MKLGTNGEPEQVVGPSDHVKKTALDTINRVRAFTFLRPII
jgi:hypothetical protein